MDQDRPTLGLLLITGLILISGNPVLSGPLAPPTIMLLFGLALRLPAPGPEHHYARRWLLLAGVFTAIFALQLNQLGSVSWPACAYFLIKLTVGGLIIHRLGEALPQRLLHAAYYLSVLSLIGYASVLLIGADHFPTLFPESLIGENLKSLLFITVHVTPEWWRNSGPMWEPGAFQGILNLALLLTPTAALRNADSRRRVAIVVLALITTFSTTGYIVLFLIIVYKIFSGRLSALLKAILLSTVITGGVAIYLEADFLAEKIIAQSSEKVIDAEFSADRFGALLFDLHYIEKSPWIGNGFHESTRYADHPWLQGEPLGHGNGLSNFTATLGFVGLFIYLVGLLTSRWSLGLSHRFFLVTIIAMLAFGEQFLNYALFLGLPFLNTHRPNRHEPRKFTAPEALHMPQESTGQAHGTA